MIVGKIFGKVATTHFSFQIEKKALKFDYVQVMHQENGYVLCQIVDIIRDDQKVIGKCNVIGYKDTVGRIQSLKDPFLSGSEVLLAQDEFIQDIVKLTSTELGAFIGKLEGRDIPIYLDLQTLLTKHVGVLAKSGAGKSYSVGVLLEEIMRKNVPLVIIDPHGEYETLKEKNTSQKEELAQFGLKPTGFRKQIVMYGDTTQHPSARPLYISDSLDAQELLHIIPGKLTTTQEGLLYSVLKQLETIDLDHVLYALEAEESPTKWHVMKMIEYLKEYNIFSKSGLSYNELVQGGRCSILNLKGISPDIQQVLVYKILKDLFELRKQEKVPPFFCVIEEAHNFAPERGFGQALSSQILRTIASEGRKFGLGLAVISQRPARVDKSVLSQLSTQITLKVTNPNDLKAISQSVEGITSESEQEIQNLGIGHALITGVVDVPLFVNIRPRMSKHGGESVNMLSVQTKQSETFMEQVDDFEKKELLPIIEPGITRTDAQLMANDGAQVKSALIPCIFFSCQHGSDSFWLLMDRVNGELITDVDECHHARLPKLHELSQTQIALLKRGFGLRTFTIEKLSKATGSLDIEKDVAGLVEKGYFEFSDTTYTVSNRYVLTNLAKYGVYKQIQFKQLEIDVQLEPQHSIDVLKQELSKFVHITDQRECYLLKYEIVEPNQ